MTDAIPYATLSDVKNELKAGTSADDQLALRYVQIASRRIDGKFFQNRALFLPYVETRRIVLRWMNINLSDNVLYVGMPMIALRGVTVGTTTVALTNVELWPPEPEIAHSLRLTDPSLSWSTYEPDTSGMLIAAVDAVWGHHPRRTGAWETVDTLSANINASVTTLTVGDVDGPDLNGFTPRLSAGNLVRIDNEYLFITATNVVTNVVTVRRGVSGTTAAAHTAGASVSVWVVEPTIRRAAARFAAQLYAKRGAFEGAAVADGGRWDFPPDIAAEILGIAQEFAYV